MYKSKLNFPSFNFPYSPSEDSRQFLVDYGRTGFVHVYKSDRTVKYSRQKYGSKDELLDFISNKPTLPLNLPEFNAIDTRSSSTKSKPSCLPSKHESKSTKIADNRTSFGNCLSHTKLDDDILLVHPWGNTMNELHFSSLAMNSVGIASQNLSKTSEFVILPETIHEINIANSFHGHVAVRTDTTCWLFLVDYSNKTQIPQFLGNVKCPSQPCSVIVSPYIPGEVAITMETGNLYLWNGDKIIEKYSPTTVSNAKCCICEYGGHPRQVVQGNESNIKLIDFRKNPKHHELTFNTFFP
ncbi:uncharacterized protein LOC124453041 isoform X2 [Xenia sp. Carnegie-2017]|uniref:uncharacterized protein LOC124453041 isoform X2 n=1 Tax=Xenia sp. Carnegie-2017 TaxID=2897299 RepID=UPI001F03AE67|nr:uncharacterized protein LOC124453041 isoform X2 [Xenia sp. Carnegie-2017]